MKTINNLFCTSDSNFSECLSSYFPREAVVPVNQLFEKKYKIVVDVGERVKEGQVIAVPIKDEKTINTSINAPFSGVVSEIGNCTLPNGRKGMAVKIKIQGSFCHLGRPHEKINWQNQSDDEILDNLCSSGVINTFGTSPSLVHQILHARKIGRLFLVVRLFDDDPSRETDSFVGQNYTDEVAEGASILARLMSAQGIIFIKSKKSSININNEIVRLFPVLSIDIDTSKYPAGFKHNIIRTVRKHVKNTQTEYFDNVNYNSVFIDSVTAYSVYEAIALGKPMMDRFVQVNGDSLNAKAMFRVKIGTPIRMLAKQCGDFVSNPGKIVINGMITGKAISDLDTPVAKDVKSITFVPKTEIYNQTFVSCIQCGKCRSICPESLCPDLIAAPLLSHSNNLFTESAELCSHCCLCNTVCPSRIPLSQLIELVGKRGEK